MTTEKKDEKPQEKPQEAKVEDEKADGSESSSDDDAPELEAVRILFCSKILLFLCVWKKINYFFCSYCSLCKYFYHRRTISLLFYLFLDSFRFCNYFLHNCFMFSTQKQKIVAILQKKKTPRSSCFFKNWKIMCRSLIITELIDWCYFFLSLIFFFLYLRSFFRHEQKNCFFLFWFFFSLSRVRSLAL